MFVLHSVTPGIPDNTYNIHVDTVKGEDQRKDWNKEYTRKKSLRGFDRQLGRRVLWLVGLGGPGMI